MTKPTTEHADTAPAPGPVIAAVIPAWNNPGELEALLGDFALLEHDSARLQIIIVDNASRSALENHSGIRAHIERISHPISFLRLTTNRGGSGGFNAGIEHALQAEDIEFVWLVDSDVRFDPLALTHLIRAIQSDALIVAAGAAIHDPDSGVIFECGGRLDTRSGRLRAALPDDDQGPIDYVAACCALIRASAIRAAGMLPNTFIHSDDVMFCQRLALATGGRVVPEPNAHCTHPRFDRFKTWARYYEARNWIGPCRLAGVGPIGRVRRAMREIALAVEQAMVASDDLARLHIMGLRDAAAGHLTGKPSPDRLKVRRFWPMHAFQPALKAIVPTLKSGKDAKIAIYTDAPLPRSHAIASERLFRDAGFECDRVTPENKRNVSDIFRGLSRLFIPPKEPLAIVHARARPAAWGAGRVLVALSPQGFRIHRLRAAERLGALLGVLLSSIKPLVMLTLAPPEAPPAEIPVLQRTTLKPTLSVIILTRDRIDQLLHTLRKLREDDTGKDCEIVVVDNASTDGTPARVKREFPDVTVLPTGANLGVEGFNRGVSASSGDAVLILDDDAWPDEGALAGVIDLLHARPDIAGIMMHRQHPRTSEFEWPFAEVQTRTPRWPDMGSGNVIRRKVWDAVGGYESGYFLYRNDTDLALKLLAAGHEVVFTPDCKVWHDSPIAKTKTARWLFRSTRNWVWLAKRHGRRGSGLCAILMGWLWAHKLAGFSPAKHLSALRGMLAGVFSKAPKLEDGVSPDGKALARLIRLKLGLR